MRNTTVSVADCSLSFANGIRTAHAVITEAHDTWRRMWWKWVKCLWRAISWWEIDTLTLTRVIPNELGRFLKLSLVPLGLYLEGDYFLQQEHRTGFEYPAANDMNYYSTQQSRERDRE